MGSTIDRLTNPAAAEHQEELHVQDPGPGDGGARHLRHCCPQNSH